MNTDHAPDKPALSLIADSIHWQSIFNAIGNPAIILDRDHRVVTANSASVRLTGMSNDEIVGKYCYEIFHRSKIGEPAAGCPMEKMRQSGVMESVDIEIEALDRTFLVSCTPILAEDGSLDKVIHVATDISPRKNIEQKLFAESAFNRSIIDNAPEGVCVFHAVPEYPYVYFTVWNERMTVITGYLLEEINASEYCQALNPDKEFRARAMERLQRTLNGDNLAGDNWVITSKQGEERVIAIWSSALRLEDNTKHVLAFFIDVTEHRNLESAMHEQQNFTKSLIQNSMAALFVLDRNHRVQVWNKTCESLTGIPHADMIGRDDHWKAFYSAKQPTLADIILDVDLADLPKFYPHVSKSEHVPNGYRIEGWFERINGKERYLIVEASPVYNSLGNMTHVIETISDLTDSKTLEEQMLHAQKMESIGGLAGGVAHEFNNILAVILGYGQVMRKGFAPDSTDINDIDQILDAAEHAVTLTKGLLAFSRKQHVSRENLDSNVLVHNVLKSLSRIMGADISIKESLAAVPLMIYADQALVTQVVMNLMANARDAMPQGGELEISTISVVFTEPYESLFCFISPGKYAHISITDNGLGMDEGTMKRIFEPFFTTKDVGKGTGLGLSVAFGIVSQHNGYISVSSAPGAGTTFDLYFPLIEQPPTGRFVPESSAEWTGGSETILLADDEPTLLILLSKMLSELGYRVIAAVDGVDAVKKFAANQNEIKLLILDVQMPKKGGLQAYREMILLKPQCRVLFISGYNLEQFDGDMALETGAELLTKPFSSNDLAAKVRKMLDAVQVIEVQ